MEFICSRFLLRIILFFSGVLVCTDVMGRGIDLPNISWVIQFDPPVSVRYKTNRSVNASINCYNCFKLFQIFSNFVHRCGRTARIGNMGNALVMLLENELPYVEFIKLNQKVIKADFIFYIF